VKKTVELLRNGGDTDDELCTDGKDEISHGRRGEVTVDLESHRKVVERKKIFPQR